MEIEHFSHEHPLILKEEHDQHDNTGICYGCLEAIKGGGCPSYYTCSSSSSSSRRLGCDFYLHKSCAELPLQIQHHPLHPQHPLILLPKSPYTIGFLLCDNCGGPWKNFSYNCSICHFDLDIFCAFPMIKRKTEHRIHKHPLIELNRSALLGCDACHAKHEGWFLTCLTCIQSFSTQFFIHRDCALLPSTLKHSGHDHLLNLAHSLLPEYIQFFHHCDICQKHIGHNSWVYCCDGCRYFAHVNCATSTKEISMEEIETPKTEPFMLILEPCNKTDIKVEDFVSNVIHLPVADQSVSLISLFLKEMKLEENKRDETTNLDHYSHEHSLTLFNIQTEDGVLCSLSKLSLMDGIKNDERCHGCMQSISNSPFYSCVQCKFLLHKCCAELPTKVINPCHPQHPLFLINNDRSFHHIFGCRFCREYFTGLGFRCDSCNFVVDVKCSLLPGTIIHEAHPQHHLVLRETTDGTNRCNACRCTFGGEFAFECNACDCFRLHISCALLPRTIRHRYDELHPFVLTYSPVRDHLDEYLCEVCERDIDPKVWFYHCVACDLSFHVGGISGCGLYPKIMFGANIDSNQHQHRLTILWKSTKSTPYECCDKDVTHDSSCFARPVLECSLCDFKVHLTCLSSLQSKINK